MSDDLSTDIPPALTADEWSAREHHSPGLGGIILMLTDFGLSVIQSGPIADGADLAALIALANAAFNQEDVRKFRRDDVVALREEAERIDDDNVEDALEERSVRAKELRDMADAIESYLPPRRIEVIEKLVR